jgi:hypothetical protein
MQFESHLGHVFSQFRGLWASECGQISLYGPLRGPVLLVAVAVARCLASSGWATILVCCLFKLFLIWGSMTCFEPRVRAGDDLCLLLCSRLFMAFSVSYDMTAKFRFQEPVLLAACCGCP